MPDQIDIEIYISGANRSDATITVEVSEGLNGTVELWCQGSAAPAQVMVIGEEGEVTFQVAADDPSCFYVIARQPFPGMDFDVKNVTVNGAPCEPSEISIEPPGGIGPAQPPASEIRINLTESNGNRDCTIAVFGKRNNTDWFSLTNMNRRYQNTVNLNANGKNELPMGLARNLRSACVFLYFENTIYTISK